MYMQDVLSDEKASTEQLQPAVRAAKDAIKSMHADIVRAEQQQEEDEDRLEQQRRVRGGRSGAESEDELQERLTDGLAQTASKFNEQCERVIGLTNEVQLLSVQRRKAEDLKLEVEDSVHEEDIKHLPSAQAALADARAALESAMNAQWKRSGDVKIVLERMKVGEHRRAHSHRHEGGRAHSHRRAHSHSALVVL
jgi:hypothetical protein